MQIVDRLLTSDNYGKGRQGRKIEAIVLHIMEGSLDGTEHWFNNNESDVSSHYGIGSMGEVRQWVCDEDTAWHAGTVVNPTASIVLNRSGVNPNYYTIGIEHEGKAEHVGTRSQLNASAELIAMLCKKYNIPVSKDFIILHREIRANKTCPGKLDTDYIMTRVKEIMSVTNSLDSVEMLLTTLEETMKKLRKELGR